MSRAEGRYEDRVRPREGAGKIYLDAEDIPETIGRIRKERTDDRENESWFSAVIRYIEESPYGKTQGSAGLGGLIEHPEKRRRLEHWIMEEIFPENSVKIKAKSASSKMQNKKPQKYKMKNLKNTK